MNGLDSGKLRLKDGWIEREKARDRESKRERERERERCGQTPEHPINPCKEYRVRTKSEFEGVASPRGKQRILHTNGAAVAMESNRG